jgi:hypothetical protein
MAYRKMDELESQNKGLGSLVLALLVIHGETMVHSSVLAQVNAREWAGWSATPTEDGHGVILAPLRQEEVEAKRAAENERASDPDHEHGTADCACGAGVEAEVHPEDGDAAGLPGGPAGGEGDDGQA